MRQVLIYPGEDQFWVAECPSLLGCISQGKTRSDAIVNIREAIALYVEVLEEDGLDLQLVVPAHDELDRGTLRAVIRQAGLSTDEFVGLL